MLFNELWQRWIGRPRTGLRTRPQAARRRSVRVHLEQLEDRTVPSSFSAANVSYLITDINAANLAGGSNTIALVAGKTFTLTAVDNTTDGATGLPVIAANDNLSITGNGDTIERSTANWTPDFRLFDVASSASLSLANLTLQGGYGALGGGAAIFSQGTLALSAVTVQNNIVLNGRGGGIYSSGSLTMQGCTVQSNQALGTKFLYPGADGGSGYGGGLYVSGGTASLTNVTIYSNTAQGGDGANGGTICSWDKGCYKVPRGNGGDGFGGGMYVAGGSVSLHNTTVDKNTAKGGSGTVNGVGEGGGLYLDTLATVCLDAFTAANVTHNSPNNIYGSYTICP
jgi:hypothetical protein